MSIQSKSEPSRAHRLEFGACIRYTAFSSTIALRGAGAMLASAAQRILERTDLVRPERADEHVMLEDCCPDGR